MKNATEATDTHDLHGVQAVLLVPDVAATLTYYRDILGFHVEFEHGSPPTHARVASGDRDGPCARIRFQLEERPRQGTPSCYLFVHVGQKLDDLFEAYRTRKVEIVSAPEDRPWGLRQFDVRDCDGFLLRFAAEI